MMHSRSSLIVLACLMLAAAVGGGCAHGGGTAPRAKLTEADVTGILDRAEAAAASQTSLVRVDTAGQRQTCRMHIIVMRCGGEVLGRRSMPDAWRGSLSIATSKAYTAICFSSDQNALTSRSIGALSQPGGPLWSIGHSNAGLFQPGLIEFPGGLPLYKSGQLVGGVGVSGDGVDEDEIIAKSAASGFEPPDAIRIDRVTAGAVPYVK